MADERMRERIQQARKEKGWSPEELALHADVSAKQVRRIEDGESNNPRLSTIRKIAEATGKEVTWLRPDLAAEQAEINARLEAIEGSLDHLKDALDRLLDAAEESGTVVRNASHSEKSPDASRNQ